MFRFNHLLKLLRKICLRINGSRIVKIPIKKKLTQTCSVKKVFFEISQNLQENTCARVESWKAWGL